MRHVAKTRLEPRIQRVNVSNIDVLKSQMLQFHRRKLQNQLRLSAFVLVTNFLNFVHDEGFHIDRVEAKTSGKFESSFERNNARFEDIPASEPLIDLGVGHGAGFVGKKVQNHQPFFVQSKTLESKK